MKPTTLLCSLTVCGVVFSLLGCASQRGEEWRSPLPGRVWEVTQLLGEPPLPDAPLTVRFDHDGAINGESGVNRFFGGYDSAESGGFQVDALGVTRRAGPPELMDQEQRFLQALQRVRSYEIDDGGRLELSAGREILILAERRQ